MEKCLLDLIDRQPVIDRAPDMELDLGGAVESCQHRKIQQAARPAIEAGPTPSVAPAPLRRDPLERHREIVGIRQRSIDVFGPEHLPPELQSFVENVFKRFMRCHHRLPFGIVIQNDNSPNELQAGFALAKVIFTRV